MNNRYTIIFFLLFSYTFIFSYLYVYYLIDLIYRIMRIGILTSGGDCPGINATIRGVCKTALNYYGIEVFGIHSGFRGLLDNDVVPLQDKDLSGLLNLGGTILGTSREKPFKKRLSQASENKPKQILKTIEDLGLDCIVCIGGNGTQKTANKLSELGVNVVSE